MRKFLITNLKKVSSTYFYFLLFIGTFFAGSFSCAEGAVLYVGTHWSGTPYATIQAAVDAASNGDEIWVEQGTYTLSPTITVNKSVSLYGGFNGTETTRDQRNWTNNMTIVDGNNSVYCFLITSTVTIDGFTITKGYNAALPPSNGGGGIENGVDGGTAGYLTVTNCIFTNNDSEKHGGAILNDSGDITVTNCTFTGNTAVNRGGAISNNYGRNMTITDCAFSGNSTNNGGAVYIRVDSTGQNVITDCTFSLNQATASNGDGGAIISDQNVTITRCIFDQNKAGRNGIFTTRGDKSAVLTNCIFSRNQVLNGGGICVNGTSGLGTLTAINCTFTGNTLLSGGKGGAIYTTAPAGTGSVFTITNCILWGNGGNQIDRSGTTQILPTVSYTDIDQDGYAGSNGNIRQDPKFVGSGNYHLQIETYNCIAISPCIDTGTSSGAPSDDLDGTSRPQCSGYDMGAYEMYSPPPPPPPPPGTHSISGVITGSVQGAVTVTLTWGSTTMSTETDSLGNYSFTGLSNATYTVTPSKSEYTFTPANQEVTVSEADVSGVNFVATAVTYSISGTINSAVQEGFTMTLSGTASATTITDSSGSYTFTGLRSGTYTVTPSKSEYTFTPTSQQVPVSGANVTGVNFVATAITYSISGKVTGVIQAGVTMTLSGTVSASTTTDSLGSYTFTGLRSGTYTVTPSKSEYKFTPASQQVTVSGENVSGVDFMAAVATYAISGTVSGAVQAGVTMMLSGIVATSTTTDSSGNYIFSGLGNGTYTVTPNKSRYAFNPPNILVTINNGNQAEQNFTATAVTYSISGTVSGAVQAGVTMTLSVAGSATTTTDASGNYAFNELENGTYTVMPSKEGYAFTPESREVVVSGEDVDRVDFVSSVSSCTIWSDVITTYDAYVTGEAIWSEVMECYNEYASP